MMQNPCRKILATMPPKKKATAKPRAVAPKEKPAHMTQQ
jgi:hypothetical protein